MAIRKTTADAETVVTTNPQTESSGSGGTVTTTYITTGPETRPKNLIQKLCEVVAELGPMKPEGFNSFHKYKYFSDEQLSSAFRDKLAKRNILLVPEVIDWDIRDFKTEKEKHSFLTTMRVRWTLMDGDSDDIISAVTVGQGDDPGDKGSNKAMTGAFKYLLIKMALIGGEGDAEADESTDKRHTAPTSPQKAAAARVEAPAAPVTGVQKGGRQQGANEPQVDTVSRLAAELGIGFTGLLNVIKNVLGVDVEMPPDPEDAKKMMRAFFEGLTSEEIGLIVQALTEAIDRKPS